jgi:hypothetical protein
MAVTWVPISRAWKQPSPASNNQKLESESQGPLHERTFFVSFVKTAAIQRAMIFTVDRKTAALSAGVADGMCGACGKEESKRGSAICIRA